ncbi:MAG: methyltransferase domain-containing protein [Pseudomonadota bacterium]
MTADERGRTARRADLLRVEDVTSPRGGLVRGTRRPPGWQPPGPPPFPPDERSELWPDTDEDLCWLAGDWRLLQRREGHRFSLDDLVTAHFAARTATTTALPAAAPATTTTTTTTTADGPGPARILDLGCGIGTVLLLMAWRFPASRVWGIEAQTVSAALARRSIAWNGAGARCAVASGDLRDATLLEEEPPFELVTGTPPYFPRGTGVESDQIQQGPCRFEHRGGIEDYAAAAARRLIPGAPFVACAAGTQTDRVLAAAAAAGLAVDRLREVIPRAGKAPLVLLFSMRHRANAPAMVVEPPLIVRDTAGRRTDEFVALRAEMGMPP